MLSTALAIQTATQDAVMDESVMTMASAMYHNKDEMTTEDFAKALFMYSAHLSALTATLVSHACLTESQIDEMIETIKEFDALGKDITNVINRTRNTNCDTRRSNGRKCYDNGFCYVS